MKKTQSLAFRYLSALILLGGFACSSFSAPVGSAAFSFGLKDQNDTLTQLEDFRGQGIILDFCAAWCVACRNFYHPGYDAFASLHGAQMILPVLMQGTTLGSLSEQSVAGVWASRFSLDKVLHVSEDSDAYTDLISNYMQGLFRPDPSLVLFPTYVFVDADLEIVGNFVGLPSSANDIRTWNRYVTAIESSRPPVDEPPPLQVPEPTTLLLTVIGLFALAPLSRPKRGHVPGEREQSHPMTVG